MKGLRPAVVSLIASAGLSILLLAVFKSEDVTIRTMNISDINYVSVVLVALGVVLLRKFKLNPIKVMLAAGVVGIFIYGLH